MAKKAVERIAIVGGGIAGLFCALVLRKHGKSVDLFETSDRFGGRIRTVRLDKQNRALGRNWNHDDLEFYVEFGPMRVELDKQLLLKSLLSHLNITHTKPRGRGRKAYLVDFPAYSSPASPHDPQYDLRSEEVSKTPLELLSMALLRVMVRIEVDSPAFTDKQQRLIDEVNLAASLHESVDRVFHRWTKTALDGRDLWAIQNSGLIDGIPLYSVGFWNLVSDHLSHNAICKLRDLGTFYHLLPENPNAAEWLVWWLIGFSISDKLQGIYGGMESIVDALIDKLAGVNLHGNAWVRTIEPDARGKFSLVFDEVKRPGRSVVNRSYDHVILALPKGALQNVEQASPVAFSREPQIKELLDSAFSFPMVKTFVVVQQRWWQKNRANRYATRVPTRELHYWKGLTPDSKQGLIMAYTDRPATSFWANYVPPGPQIDAHQPTGKQLPPLIERRLKQKICQYINDNNVPDITPDDIVWYGIRDWGRAPYGGANHAWRPERKYWVVMRRLAELASPNSDRGRLHVCGEAYSDYHGFIEGALRSAVYVLHRILDRRPNGAFAALPWLSGQSPSSRTRDVLSVDDEYLAELRDWAASLDAVGSQTAFL